MYWLKVVVVWENHAIIGDLGYYGKVTLLQYFAVFIMSDYLKNVSIETKCKETVTQHVQSS